VNNPEGNGEIMDAIKELGRPIKLKPGRPVILTITTPKGEKVTAVITPEDADGGQAARVQGAKPSYPKTSKA